MTTCSFDGILASISRFDLIDALDILLVAVMIYYLRLARTTARQGDTGVEAWAGFHCITRLTELFRTILA
ncbi:MAG: hypothetical protein ACLUVV_00300 [Christensenellales bacterium]